MDQINYYYLMDWSKLTKSQLDDFLALYGVTGSSKEAENLFSKLGPGSPITEPVRDLYIASTIKNNPLTYTHSDILNLSDRKLRKFRKMLYLDSSESGPNLRNHIINILTLADLIKDDIQLPPDIYKLIALRLDYDSLSDYCRSTKLLNQLCVDDLFWIDKIKYDFGIHIPLTIGGSLRQLYVKIATQNHYPVIGSENYAIAYKDLCLLLHKVTKVGKSSDRVVDITNRLIGKIEFLYTGEIPTIVI